MSLAAFGASSLLVHAQPAPKILVVDVVKLYVGYYKVEAQIAKFTEEEKQASAALGKAQAEGNTLIAQYRELVDQAKNPALTNEARTKAENDAQKMGEQIQAKQNEFNTLRDNTERSLQERNKAFRDLILEEINKIATDIAVKKGADLLLDKSGASLAGIPVVLHSDASYDITEEVMKELNRGRPAKAATATPFATPAPTPAKTGDAPMITVPGAKK